MNNEVKKSKTIDEISIESLLPKKFLITNAQKLNINPSIEISHVDAKMLIETTRKVIENNTSFNSSTLSKKSVN